MRCARCLMPAVLAALVLQAPPAWAETVVLTAVKDNSVFSSSEAASNALGDLFSGTTGPAGGAAVQRCLVMFDVAGHVPMGAEITSVDLRLTLVQGSAAGGEQLHALHRLNDGWGEGTSFASGGGGGPATPGDVTWVYKFYPQADQTWQEAGGDFVASASAAVPVGSEPEVVTWGPTPAVVEDVQTWLDDPSSNFGWILIGNELTGSTARRFASRESELAEQRPTLTVEFEPPPVPGLDVRPGSCPNPINRRSHGVLPVAVLGSEDFDPHLIDAATLQLGRADEVGGVVAPLSGPQGPAPVVGDAGTPFVGPACACHDLAGDGFQDLLLKFSIPELITSLELGSRAGNTAVELVLSGYLLDGSSFAVSDCVLVLDRGGP